MPDKRVRVFCAANSGFCVYQSMLQYQRLKALYKMDWVISMDGVNEPLIHSKDSSVRDLIKNEWSQYPIFRSPLKYIIPVTQHSVFINSLKQALFENKMSGRLKKAKQNNFPARTKWLTAAAAPLLYNADTQIIRNSVDSFFYYMKAFDRQLSMDNIPHLLFIQPHLTLRDTLKSSPTEKALLHYYESASYNNAEFNMYIKEIHAGNELAQVSGRIYSLGFIHENNFETFVDYCHFSPEAIRQLAIFFAGCIISGDYLQQHP
jgi:hypothetical protein